MMNIDERITALTSEMETAKQEMQKLLLDIRVFILEAQNPMGNNKLNALKDADTHRPKIDMEVKADDR